MEDKFTFNLLKFYCMRYLLLFFIVVFASCTQNIYVVRHAEKGTMQTGMEPGNPPLSTAGNERAQALKTRLQDKKIRSVFSTNYKRTISTVSPLSDVLGVTIQLYPASMDSMNNFIQKIRQTRKGNILIAGHSNTIDDIANKLAGPGVVPGDLPETEYNNLFIIRRKGNRYSFSRSTYGN